MKITRNSTSKNVKSEYGDFDFTADDNHEINSFIDFESKLIVVEEKPTSNKNDDQAKTRYYVIDPIAVEVLSHEEYKKYFNYEPQIKLSEDGEFKLEYQRKYDADKGIDIRVQKLTHIKSGKVFSDGKEDAFEKTKFRTPLQRYKDSLREAEEKRRNIVRIDLEKHHKIASEKLIDNDVIVRYYDSKNIYELVFKEDKFKLYRKEGTSRNPWNYSPPSEIVMTFSSVREFWEYFSTDKEWYIENTAFKIASDRGEKENVLAKYIIKSGNEIRLSDEYNQKNHDKIRDWQGVVSSRNIDGSTFKQYCSNCKVPVRYNPRYSIYICRNCYQIATDKSGRRVAFYNTELLGYGCQGYYLDKEPKEKYNSNLCYIGEKVFYAEEARFGGIVIQRKE